jgi:carboxypeptidase PM20D1
MKRIFGVALILIVLGFCVCLIRTLRLKAPPLSAATPPEISLSTTEIGQRLAEGIQLATIAESPKRADNFPLFRNLLRRFFPKTHQALKPEVVGNSGLLFTWRGKNARLKPILLLAHVDVVPAPENRNKFSPFSGQISEGFVWGRGTLDDKASLMGWLESVEWLLACGFTPERSLYFAFGEDEEVGGLRGAHSIAAILENRGLSFEFVLDEGGFILEGVLKEISRPVAIIGVAEKGYVTVQLTAKGEAGHSSAPPSHTAIGRLSQAIVSLEKDPFPGRLEKPTREMLEQLAPAASFGKKFVLANLWLFEPLVIRLLSQSVTSNATIRTTTAATTFHSGTKDNVLPEEATAEVNFRLLPGDTVDSVVTHVKKNVSPEIKVDLTSEALDPSPISPSDSDAFRQLKANVEASFPGVLVVPSLCIGGTDARHYARLSSNLLRFLPLTLTSDDLDRIHGIDERISLEAYAKLVRYYITMIKGF